MFSEVRGAIVQILNPINLLRAVGYTSSGFAYAARRERAFQQELIVTAAGIPLAVFLGDSGVERVLLIGSLFLVLIVELLNSAIETVVDRIGTEPNELSGRAKNLGSLAVFVSLVNVLVVWALVLVS
ncbi:MAG: diacylglycerol kinase [Chloroflexi bacterium]|nr:diacylglycerol kinase [Chloroflexota bacterium]